MTDIKNKNDSAGRVFIVGYFIGKEDKMAFADLLADRDLYFLESSAKVKSQGNIIKVPQRLSSIKMLSMLRHFFKKPKVNAEIRRLYRRDLVAYFSNVARPYQSITKERKLLKKPVVIFFYSWFVAQKAYKLSKCRHGKARSFALASVDLFRQFRLGDALSFDTTREVRSMLLRVSFAAGLNYYKATIKEIAPKAGDLFLSWGSQYSGNLLLDLLIKDTDADRLVLEYGEIPGTVSVNKNGIFGLSDIASDWDAFCKLEIDDQDRSNARTVLAEISYQDAGSRGGASGLFDIYQNMFSLNPTRKKVAYVNGSELVASGHIYNSNLFGPNLVSPNAFLLQRACERFPSEDYIVLYKDHPMTKRQSKTLALDEKEFPGVIFVNSLRMKTLLELADVVITFPSKVVMTSLMMQVKTIVVGGFTVPNKNSKMGLYDESEFVKPEAIDQSIDYFEYVDFVTRMLKYKLIKLDYALFPDLNIKLEQEKLLSLLGLN